MFITILVANLCECSILLHLYTYFSDHVKKNMFKKNASRVSSSGRKILTPRHDLSTSDEEVVRKKHKSTSDLRNEVKKLQ